MGMFDQDKQEAHRPGVFKKPNKPHKTGRHRSKGSISSDAGGRLSVKKITKFAKKELGKTDKRNRLAQIRSNKRKEALDKKRNLGSAKSPPILIAVIGLQEDLNVHSIVNLLTSADEEAVVTDSPNATHITIPRFKQRFSIVVPPAGNLFATLDLAKVADTILLVTSAVYESDKSQRSEVIDSWGEELLHSVASQGLPTPILAVTNLDSLPIQKRQDHKNHVHKTLFKWLPEEKIMNLDKSSDAINVLRCAGNQKQRNVTYRNKRSYLLAEDVQFKLDNDNSESNFGSLEVTGYLRGLPLSVYGLVHIPGFGDYQMSFIEKCKDPFSSGNSKVRPGTDVDMNETKLYVIEDPEKQESLESENLPDPMDAEQTWPTDEELAAAEAQSKRKIVKRVPKGTSEYQAAWIPDEDGEEYDEEDDDDEEEERMTVDEAQSEVNSDIETAKDEEDEEYETITISETNEQRYDEKLDLYEEKQALLKLKEAKQDSEFPDEVDTPQDMLAKDRFQKYRGLESFRTTQWDKKENLPYDYARIFQFENFDRTRRRVFREREDLLNNDETDAQPGSYVKICIKGISKELFDAYRVSNQPLVVFGLLQYEHKISVLNFILRRTLDSKVPIKSKERLIFQCGFRRFTARPVFSQHTNGNKHKYERFFQPNSTAIATMFAPITFPPCPVICYLEKTDGSLEMVASGSLLSVNPDRLVIKRVVLSGHPFKVHKKSAVIRFMFFNREDIRWFKPVKLRTKYGRKGHIKEPLGTHGHMKCIFDGQLKSQDTILMNLYKRVFPKWTYEPLLLTVGSKKVEATDVQME